MKDSEGHFMGFTSPRFTQVPDEAIDEVMPQLSGAETKVMFYTIRRTYGFKKNSDQISISQMVNGIRRRDGSVLDSGTGLSKNSVIQAVKSLIEKGVLVKNRIYSDDTGFEASEYALKIIDPPMLKNVTREVLPKIGQGVVQKSDRQDTAVQETGNTVTFPNVSKRHFYRGPVDKSQRQKEEYLAELILQVCHDRQSIGYYRQVVHALPEHVVHETLSQVKEAEKLGRIRERAGAMFTDLIKRKAAELGIKFGAEQQNKELSKSEIKAETSAEESNHEMAYLGMSAESRR